MIEKLSGIKLPIDVVNRGREYEEEHLLAVASKRLRAPVKYFRIVKKSLDARKKNDLHFVYTIEFSSQAQTEVSPLARLGECREPHKRVAVVGAGPAGLFCALRLLQWGLRPVILERGAPVEDRQRDIQQFFDTGVLDTQSNVQFGEGGAGTFSDGKLNTQTNNKENFEVLLLFTAFGAPKEILYLSKPHVGSDNLQRVVKNIREYIIRQGGQFYFHTTVEDVTVIDNKATSLLLNSGEKMDVDDVVFAVGHSARDTFQMLERKGTCLQCKDFAVGVRIEQLQAKIGLSQYGESYQLLPPADYKLVSHASDRAAFTFCMCPGGVVMPATSEQGGVVVNGMSNFARNERNANSALIVQVRREDFESSSPLAGVAYQRKLERLAFEMGGGGYQAPVQRVEDFLKNRKSTGAGEVLPSYQRGVTFTNLNGLFSGEISSALRLALPDMDKKLHGFAHPDAILTGVESRTSSPVRIVRGENGESVTILGLYPCGEGAGYAGGITSAAADGLRTAEKIVEKYGKK